MKHVLRIGIVLILVVGIGFLIFHFVGSKTPYDVFADYTTLETSINSLDDKIESLKISGDSANKFYEQQNIYNYYKASFNMNLKNVQLLNLSSSEKSNLKNLKADLSGNLNNLISGVDAISEYLTETNPNADYLNDIIDDACTKFIALNKNFYSVCVNFQSLINNKIYDGKAYTLSDTLNMNLLYVTKAYYNLGTTFGYSKVNALITNFNKILNANNPVSNAGATFMINFYSFEDDFITEYESYLKNGTTTNTRLNEIMNFATEGV